MEKCIDYNKIEAILEKVIREELQKYIITEMALSLSDYKKRVEDRIQQILENWCLIRYVTITGDKEMLKNHWKKELLAQLNYIGAMKVKNGDSSSTKLKAVYQIWNMFDLDTDERCIAQRLYTKFKGENINIKSPEFAQVVSDFKDNIKLISYAMLETSPENLQEFVDEI